VKRQSGRTQRPAKLVCDEAQMLGRLTLELEISLPHVLSQGVRDASVQPFGDDRLITRADHQPFRFRDFQDALVQSTILTDDLGDIEAQAKSLFSVLFRVCARWR
jgi:hypothetical protein